MPCVKKVCSRRKKVWAETDTDEKHTPTCVRYFMAKVYDALMMASTWWVMEILDMFNRT